jgi:hypothetical protein
VVASANPQGPNLIGCTAIIGEGANGWLIQADERCSGYGYGWWWFPFDDWKVEE